MSRNPTDEEKRQWDAVIAQARRKANYTSLGAEFEREDRQRDIAAREEAKRQRAQEQEKAAAEKMAKEKRKARYTNLGAQFLREDRQKELAAKEQAEFEERKRQAEQREKDKAEKMAREKRKAARGGSLGEQFLREDRQKELAAKEQAEWQQAKEQAEQREKQKEDVGWDQARQQAHEKADDETGGADNPEYQKYLRDQTANQFDPNGKGSGAPLSYKDWKQGQRDQDAEKDDPEYQQYRRDHAMDQLGGKGSGGQGPLSHKDWQEQQWKNAMNQAQQREDVANRLNPNVPEQQTKDGEQAGNTEPDANTEGGEQKKKEPEEAGENKGALGEGVNASEQLAKVKGKKRRQDKKAQGKSGLSKTKDERKGELNGYSPMFAVCLFRDISFYAFGILPFIGHFLHGIFVEIFVYFAIILFVFAQKRPDFFLFLRKVVTKGSGLMYIIGIVFLISHTLILVGLKIAYKLDSKVGSLSKTFGGGKGTQ